MSDETRSATQPEREQAHKPYSELLAIMAVLEMQHALHSPSVVEAVLATLAAWAAVGVKTAVQTGVEVVKTNREHGREAILTSDKKREVVEHIKTQITKALKEEPPIDQLVNFDENGQLAISSSIESNSQYAALQALLQNSGKPSALKDVLILISQTIKPLNSEAKIYLTENAGGQTAVPLSFKQEFLDKLKTSPGPILTGLVTAFGLALGPTPGEMFKEVKKIDLSGFPVEELWDLMAYKISHGVGQILMGGAAVTAVGVSGFMAAKETWKGIKSAKNEVKSTVQGIFGDIKDTFTGLKNAKTSLSRTVVRGITGSVVRRLGLNPDLFQIIKEAGADGTINTQEVADILRALKASNQSKT